MKKLLIFLLLIMPIISFSQAHLFCRTLKVDTIKPLTDTVYIDILKVRHFNMLTKSSCLFENYPEHTIMGIFISLILGAGIISLIWIIIWIKLRRIQLQNNSGKKQTHIPAIELYTEDDMISLVSYIYINVREDLTVIGKERGAELLKQWEEQK